MTIGTNELIGTDPTKLAPALSRLMDGKWKKGAIPPLWNGEAAQRIVECLERVLDTKQTGGDRQPVKDTVLGVSWERRGRSSWPRVSHRSSGLRPVTFDRRASMRGPISSRS